MDIIDKNEGTSRNQNDMCNSSTKSNYADVSNQLADRSKILLENSTATQFLYRKRTGTSGLGGQLYETKLISLILLRLLKDNNSLSEFQLGTNIDEIGAFDDIVLRYKRNGLEKPKVVFIQAKHRDDPNKNKLNIEDVLQEKYLDSYIKIKHKFVPNCKDDIFNSTFEDVECSFVFYTPAVDNLNNKKLVIDTSIQYLITGSTKDVFQFDYNENDIVRLIEKVSILRAKLLVKSLMKFVLKGNYHNIMTDDLIKTYHVYLAQNVLDLSDRTSTVLNAKFSDYFLKSDNHILKYMRDIIYDELMTHTKSTTKVEMVAKSLSFKLPPNFGNLYFCIKGKYDKRKRRIEYLCSKLKRLLDESDEMKVIKINDAMLGPNEILQAKDLEIYRLGGLVGNLLIGDSETGMLKLNNNEGQLSEDAVELYNCLKNNWFHSTDLNQYRLDIGCNRFPKLSLHDSIRDRQLVQNFFDTLILYTNQAQEDEVERILKDEINQYCNISGNANKSLYRIKEEAVFFKVHHEIQKWRKQPVKAPYLNNTCNFYEETRKEIFNSSLLSTLNYFCIKNITNIGVQFKDTLIDSVLPDTVLKNNRIINIVTEDVLLTSIKLRANLLKATKSPPIFLDLPLIVSEDCVEAMVSEIKKPHLELLVILCNDYDLFDKLRTILKSTKNKTIVVTQWVFNIQEVTDLNTSQGAVEIINTVTKFSDLTDESQNEHLDNTIVTYQGFEILLGKLLEKRLYGLMSAELLNKIICKENIIIGKSLNNSEYQTFKDCYVEQSISRFIKLNYSSSLKTEFTVLTGNFEDTVLTKNQDIIIISDKVQEFHDLHEKYRNYNIHWFIQIGKDTVWKETYGKLNKLLRYVERKCDYKSCTKNLSTLFDIEERIVILSGEPGMGKSTLMTYLSVQTKAAYPQLWIIQINLINYKNLFSCWQDDKANIDLQEVMKFLFVASRIQVDKSGTVIKSDYSDHDFNNINVSENGTIFVSVEEKSLKSALDLEIETFCDCYNTGQLVLLFDGYDEISPDYTAEVLAMMNVLNKSNIRNLWISSRSYNIINDLQILFGTFSFTLMPMAVDQQKRMLEKAWAIKLCEPVNDRLQFDVNRFYETMSLAINDKDNKFTSVPLHLYMISEMYQHFFRDYYNLHIPKLSEKYMSDINAASNLITFYQRFAEIKFFKIGFSQKKPFVCTKDPVMKRMIERERKDFIENHKMLAAYLLFDRDVDGLFNDGDNKKVFEIMESIKQGAEKTGIVDQIIDNIPKFIHMTYAEYFATEYLCDKLKSKNCSVAIWIYLFNTIFKSFVSLRKFFECKLQIDPELFELSLNKTHKREVFNALLKQMKSENTSLSVAAMKNSERIAAFILNSMRAVTTKENLDDYIKYVCKRCQLSCVFCFAVDRGKKILFLDIMNIVKDIDQSKVIQLFTCEDVPTFNALGIALNFYKYYKGFNMLDDLLEDIDSESLLQLFIMPCNFGLRAGNALHVVVLGYDTISNIKKYLLRMNKDQLMQLFIATDADGKLPAHYAGEHGDESFFNVMEELLDSNQYRRICMTRDPLGQTPLTYLRGNIHHWQRLQALIKEANANPNAVRIYPM